MTSLSDKVITYYIENHDESAALVIKLVDELLSTKSSSTRFYCHNFGGFDVIFRLKLLVDFNDLDPDSKYDLATRFKENRILCIKISKGKNQVYIKNRNAIFNR